MQDLIVESRHWRHGVEIVSHVNHSQLGRVRMALGISLEPWRHPFGGGPRLVWDRGPRQEQTGEGRRRRWGAGTRAG